MAACSLEDVCDYQAGNSSCISGLVSATGVDQYQALKVRIFWPQLLASAIRNHGSTPLRPRGRIVHLLSLFSLT